ncbi:hypothetical protein BLOT_013273 [Blomia tropicalis]|nr:hypothetical protein BLOT_013273 [Blomia tropicalis]
MIGDEFKVMSPLSDDICEQNVHDRNIKRGTTCKDHMPISYLVICRHLIHRFAYYHPLFYEINTFLSIYDLDFVKVFYFKLNLFHGGYRDFMVVQQQFTFFISM